MLLLLVDDAMDVEAVGVGGVGGGDRGRIVSNMTDDDSSLLISSECCRVVGGVVVDDVVGVVGVVVDVDVDVIVVLLVFDSNPNWLLLSIGWP